MNDLRPDQRELPEVLFFRPTIDQITASVDNNERLGMTAEQCARHGGTVRVGKYRLAEIIDVTAEYAIVAKYVAEVKP